MSFKRNQLEFFFQKITIYAIYFKQEENAIQHYHSGCVNRLLLLTIYCLFKRSFRVLHPKYCVIIYAIYWLLSQFSNIHFDCRSSPYKMYPHLFDCLIFSFMVFVCVSVPVAYLQIDIVLMHSLLYTIMDWYGFLWFNDSGKDRWVRQSNRNVCIINNIFIVFNFIIRCWICYRILHSHLD